MNKKRSRIVFSIYFFVVIPGLFILAENNIGYFIDRQLSKQNVVAESTGADFDLWSRSVSIDKVKLTNPMLGQVTCTNLRISKIGLVSLLVSGGFHAQSIAIDSLFIDIDVLADTLPTDTMSASKRRVTFGVGRLDIGYGMLDFIDQDSSRLTFGFHVDSLQYDSKVGANQGSVVIRKAVFDLAKDFSTIRADSIAMNLDQGVFSGNTIAWESNLTRREFSKKFPYQKGQFHLVIPSFTMNGFSLQALHDDAKGIKCQRMVVDTFNLKSYKDKRQPFPDRANIPLLADMIKSVPVKFGVDTLQLVNAYIQHQESFPGASLPGSVSFARLYATFYNVSSANDDTMILDAQATVLGEGKLKAHFELNPSPKSSHVSGTLSPMSLTRANQMTIAAAGLDVEKGMLKHMDFNFDYDNDRSTGKMNMHYDDLSFQIIDPDTGEQNAKQGITTLIANTFIVKDSNLPDKNNYRVGSISFARDKKKAVFGYWWRSVLSGIKTSVGVDKELS
ncbi:DUF748 domain-containing protein [Gilvimarinus agarilyticus]|uniref:DUF748 domain-containing protein n=1 Tax=Reichenbachiella agariperforans TaxID=156994 RepID=UPI001C08ACDE|nr:DUF748 domain-containing protein [Reichenbachiella agariperforans]MBU2884813.1 DUF748 domain-containing protein [Gilvimarinus agarilyticus]MBU2912983.1 DUF748 domain-containing protein [Reichenbachiella agariperforans]